MNLETKSAHLMSLLREVAVRKHTHARRNVQRGIPNDEENADQASAAYKSKTQRLTCKAAAIKSGFVKSAVPGD